MLLWMKSKGDTWLVEFHTVTSYASERFQNPDDMTYSGWRLSIPLPPDPYTPGEGHLAHVRWQGPCSFWYNELLMSYRPWNTQQAIALNLSLGKKALWTDMTMGIAAPGVTAYPCTIHGGSWGNVQKPLHSSCFLKFWSSLVDWNMWITNGLVSIVSRNS